MPVLPPYFFNESDRALGLMAHIRGTGTERRNCETQGEDNGLHHFFYTSCDLSARSYLDHGGTTPLVRAYAIDCPRCSCWSSRISISAPCFVMSLPNSFTGA